MFALNRPHYPISVLLGLLLAGCTSPTTTPSPTIVGMANPASVYCIKQGGQLLPQKDSAGNEFSMCRLADGRAIEEWALFRQQNKPPQP
jgi:uncharacterized protein